MADERQDYDGRWNRLKVLAATVVIAFAVTLAIVVGNRLSDEALAVLAGAVCGVGAAIPTSLLVVAVTRRRDEARAPPTRYQAQASYPPVVVVTPPAGQRWQDGRYTLPPTVGGPVQRHFEIVGGTPVETEGPRYGRRLFDRGSRC